MEALDFNRIHKFHFDDLNILIDINSGSLHLIDQMTWDFLDLLNENTWSDALTALSGRYDAQEAQTVANEVRSLIEAGQLFSDDAEVKSYVPHTQPIVKIGRAHV